MVPTAQKKLAEHLRSINMVMSDDGEITIATEADRR